jgi:hypothetical protein
MISVASVDETLHVKNVFFLRPSVSDTVEM